MQIPDRIKAFHDEMTAWRHDLHAHPELGFEEHCTSEFVAGKLAKFGCEVASHLSSIDDPFPPKPKGIAWDEVGRLWRRHLLDLLAIYPCKYALTSMDCGWVANCGYSTNRSKEHRSGQALLRASHLAAAFLVVWAALTDLANAAQPVQVLNSAKAFMQQASGYHVEAVISNKDRRIPVSADIAGNDYDISVSGTRTRKVGASYWISQDGGQSWRNTVPDSGLFDLLTAPMVQSTLPDRFRLAEIERSTEANLTVVLLQLQVDQQSDDQIQYRVVTMPSGKTWIDRFTGRMTFAGGLVMVDALYSKVGEISRIMPPRTR
jgi:hypothetical protein